MPNYKSFDDVLNELEMDEDELKRLVSEGQIRAFRDDDKMKFRSEDVQSLSRARHSAPGGGEIDLGETQLGGESLEIIEEETDETLLDLGNLSSDQDFEDTGATSVPTVELSDIGEDQDATLTEELVFDETDELGGLDFGEDDADATQKIEGGLDLSDDDDVGLQTEPVETGGLDELDELDDVGELDDLGGEEATHDYADTRMAGPPMGMPGAVQIQEQVKYVEIVPNEGIAWKVLTGLTFLLVMVLMVTPPALGISSGSDNVPLGSFWGSISYSMYLKGPNQQGVIAQSAYEAEDPNKRNDPEPFSVSNGADDIVWPGMKVIRDFNGYAIDSASATGGTGSSEEAPAE
ncbi:MAG: hypothetical protein H6841_03500 [Planctomycetes bacterium]|nr:hypothetical protein [Planctomycetota bacterium]MCB9934185.1 hypothetical protein [Planctomycetota bacterium]